MLRPHVSQLARERERGVLQAELSLFFFLLAKTIPASATLYSNNTRHFFVVAHAKHEVAMHSCAFVTR